MELKPLGDKVIVEILEADEKTKGGIILPETAKEKPQEAKVISTGTGQVLPSGKTIPPEVKKGDHIVFGKYSGNEIKVNDGEYLIISHGDILAVIK